MQIQELQLPPLLRDDAPVDLAPPEHGTRRRRLRACPECDWLVALPPLRPGQKADCPRCATPLVKRHGRPAQRSMALATAGLVALAVALGFPFLRFSASGIDNRIHLTQIADILLGFDQLLVAVVVLLFILVLPALYLLAVIWLQLGLLQGCPLPLGRAVARALCHLRPWMMGDVFIIGALVSLIKIADMAQIEIGPGFWAFCAFDLLLVLTIQSLDRDWLWFALAGEPRAPAGARTGHAAAAQGLAACPTCGLINRPQEAVRCRCRRCGEAVHFRHPASLQQTWALLAAAALMYLPANLYPIMTTTYLGHAESATIVGGIVVLFQLGSWPVAAVIFLASVIIPLAKLLALIWLCLAASGQLRLSPLTGTRVHRFIDFVGRWSMIDIFVVAILVALVRAESLLSVSPGPAALAFAAVVVLTILATRAFDPRLLWRFAVGPREART